MIGLFVSLFVCSYTTRQSTDATITSRTSPPTSWLMCFMLLPMFVLKVAKCELSYWSFTLSNSLSNLTHWLGTCLTPGRISRNTIPVIHGTMSATMSTAAWNSSSYLRNRTGSSRFFFPSADGRTLAISPSRPARNRDGLGLRKRLRNWCWILGLMVWCYSSGTLVGECSLMETGFDVDWEYPQSRFLDVV